MADNGGAQYDHQTIKVIRGREAKKIAEMERQGWQVTQQTTGKIRTEITFRRVKKPMPWKVLAALGAVVVLGIAIFGIVAALTGGDEDSERATDLPSVSASRESDQPSDEPTPTPSDSAEASDTPSATVSETPSDTASETPTDEPSSATTQAAPTETPTQAPTTTEPTGLPADAILTSKNSPDLKKMLEANDNYALNRAFAKNYGGRSIQFDGSVADATPGYYLVYYGDDSATSGSNTGPAFQFRVRSLPIDGGGAASTGDNLRFVATVGAFNADQGLFFLTPVKVTAR